MVFSSPKIPEPVVLRGQEEEKTHLHWGMKGCFVNMETHLQMLLEEWRVAIDLSFGFHFYPGGCLLAPWFQISQAILGQLFNIFHGMSLSSAEMFLFGYWQELELWKDDSLSAEPPSLMIWFSLSYSEGHLLTLFRPTSGPSWEYCSGKNSMLSSGSDMWQVFRSC